MSFEYNGVVYRGLEPQVRYDAEQVQLLKQADVTINENLQTVNESLQTVNTEISNKLTKPTNPSAESAVTMLADGTVGTKPLSEIGGGGKLYRHDVKITNIVEGSAEYFKMSFLSTSGIETTDINQIVDQNDFKPIVDILGYIQIVKFSGAPVCFPLSFAFGYFGGVIYSEDAASLYKTYYQSLSVSNAGTPGTPANIIHTDTVTEI